MCTPKFYAILVIYRMGDTLDTILVILMFTFSFVFIALPIIAIATLLFYGYKFITDQRNHDMYDIDEDVGTCEHCGDTKDWCRKC